LKSRTNGSVKLQLKKKEDAKIKREVNRQSLIETNRRSVKELEGGRYGEGQLWLWPATQGWR